ncbi:hypothetical protein FJV83_27320 [Mesorhizobium sp. WSM4307]|uniref:hypothetical protein n=1 Tax=unclassified Mesorhizobium TaxID=325217 RepID=UPI00115ECC4F|nr:MULTISPECIES: hypothetical protein [unclassified Mesorhizobium]TRC77339.1 hypothetical protein FJV81_12385 [Mesorhizobium sp. WSM4315]TRC79980.1 hypothetical protein FJV83_27320 [Mesorhizobium sp. WSM4307]
MKLNNGPVSGFAGFLLCLSACSAVQSYKVGGDEIEHTQQRAGTYYLPKHLLDVKIFGEGKAENVTVDPIAVQDSALALETGLSLSGLSDDKITVTFDKTGLLASVSATLTDRTGDILVELAKIAAHFRAAPADKPLLQEVAFDPFDSVAAKKSNDILKGSKSCVEVELRPGVWSPGCDLLSLGKSTGSPIQLYRLPKSVMPGIYYRRAASRMVHVVLNGKTVMLVPRDFANDEPIYRIDINRSAFVTRSTEIKFEDGALISVMVDKPSEVLAAVKLPLAIVSAVVDSATAGTAGAKSASLNADAAKSNSQANLANVAAAKLASSEGSADAEAYKQALLSGGNGSRDAALTTADIAYCNKYWPLARDRCYAQENH